MKYVLLLVLFLVPSFAAQAHGPVVVYTAYSRGEQFSFRMKDYSYTGLVQAIRAAYPAVHIDVVNVDLGVSAPTQVRQDACRLGQDLATQVKVYVGAWGKKQELSCAQELKGVRS